MSRDIQVEILEPCVMPGEEFSIALLEEVEGAVFCYSIVDSRTYAIVMQSGETEETVWAASVPVAGEYYIRVDATFGDGSLVNVTEPLSVCQL